MRINKVGKKRAASDVSRADTPKLVVEKEVSLHLSDPGGNSDGAPRLVEVPTPVAEYGSVLLVLSSGEDPGGGVLGVHETAGASGPSKRAQHLSTQGEVEGALRSALRVGEVKYAPPNVQVFPLRALEASGPRAREQREPVERAADELSNRLSRL